MAARTDPAPRYTDTTKAVGTAGMMFIRDHGSTVEFHITCSNSQTYVGAYTWSGTVNGQPVGGTVTLNAGFQGQLLGSWPVATTQTVSWHQNDTGTSGLGGAADISANINRGSIPGTGTKVTVSAITTTSATMTWPAIAGASTVGLYVAYDAAFTSYFFQAWIGNVTTRPMTGMAPGTKYWVRTRASNAQGVGAYGPSTPFVTASGVYVSNGTAWILAPVSLSDGAVWGATVLQVSNGTAWKVPT